MGQGGRLGGVVLLLAALAASPVDAAAVRTLGQAPGDGEDRLAVRSYEPPGAATETMVAHDCALAENGDPRGQNRGAGTAGQIDMIDWIELIPINETRNYVQRVLENVVVYRAKRGETTPTLVAEWTK